MPRSRANLPPVAYGYHGIQRYKRQHLSVFAPVNWPYWALIGVGIFSGLYHSFLKYHTQMADEMSMHLAIGCVLIQVFTFRKPEWEQRRNTLVIVLGLTAFVIYHCVTDEFVMHVALFFGMSVTVSWKTSRITKETIQDQQVRKRLHSLTTFATCKFSFLASSRGCPNNCIQAQHSSPGSSGI
jgi:dihydroceramidase